MTAFHLAQPDRQPSEEEVRSDEWLARAIGKPRASHTVGQVLGTNLAPILVLRHRVVATDGSLGGYAGSFTMKEMFLECEGGDSRRSVSKALHKIFR